MPRSADVIYLSLLKGWLLLCRARQQNAGRGRPFLEELHKPSHSLLLPIPVGTHSWFLRCRTGTTSGDFNLWSDRYCGKLIVVMIMSLPLILWSPFVEEPGLMSGGSSWWPTVTSLGGGRGCQGWDGSHGCLGRGQKPQMWGPGVIDSCHFHGLQGRHSPRSHLHPGLPGRQSLCQMPTHMALVQPKHTYQVTKLLSGKYLADDSFGPFVLDPASQSYIL